MSGDGNDTRRRGRMDPRVNVVIAFALAIGLGLATTLIVLGGRPGPAALPEIEMTAGELARLGGLVLPDDIADFRSVALEDNLQYDITFTMSASAVAEFIERSGLPEPTADKRLLIHASPLWDLNSPEGSTISSTGNNHDDVTRSVELITPAATPTSTTTLAGPTEPGEPEHGTDANAGGNPADGTQVTVHISLTPAR